MIAPRTLQRIDLLIPELFAHEGGIQAYSRTLLQALRQIRPHTQLRVFIRNDAATDLPGSDDSGITFHPAGRSNRRLLTDLLSATLQHRPDLLLSTHPHFAALQRLHQRITGVPSWCSAHGIDVWTLRPGLRRWGLGGLQRLLPVSRFTADQLRRLLGRRCPPLTILPNSYDDRRFRPGPRSPLLLQRYGLRPDQPVIFTLSRLSRSDRYKNIEALIDALPALLSRFGDLRLIVAGDGDHRSHLQAHAVALGVAPQVTFTGLLAESEVAEHHRLASVFALPSEKEGFGIVFLEALACGRPTLAGNRDGSTDPLADGAHGLLVDPRLPLAPPLQALLEGRGERLWFSPESLSESVARSFGFAAFCGQLEALLRLLEQQPAPGRP